MDFVEKILIGAIIIHLVVLAYYLIYIIAQLMDIPFIQASVIVLASILFCYWIGHTIIEPRLQKE